MKEWKAGEWVTFVAIFLTTISLASGLTFFFTRRSYHVKNSKSTGSHNINVSNGEDDDDNDEAQPMLTEHQQAEVGDKNEEGNIHVEDKNVL